MKFYRDGYARCGVVCYIADVRTSSGGEYCLVGFPNEHGFHFNYWSDGDFEFTSGVVKDVPEELRKHVESEFFEIDVKRFVDRYRLKIVRWI